MLSMQEFQLKFLILYNGLISVIGQSCSSYDCNSVGGHCDEHNNCSCINGYDKDGMCTFGKLVDILKSLVQHVKCVGPRCQ